MDAQPFGSEQTPVRVQVDNPGGSWLVAQQHAALWRARKGGVVSGKMIDGATTAWAHGIALPGTLLASIPGAADERRGPGDWHFEALLRKVMSEGWSDQWPVLVVVNHEGHPFLVEGNTRVAVAIATGVPAVPVEVRWVNGGERVDGALPPALVEALGTVVVASVEPLERDFKRWFACSKAVDEAGRPKMLYHGSHQPLVEVMTAEQVMADFDAKTAGLPARVIDGERKILETTAGALWFTDSEYVASGYADQRSGTPTVTEAYLSLQNPLNLDEMDVEQVSQLLSLVRGRPVEVSREYGWAKGIAHAVVHDSGSLIQYAKANGYDGLIYPDTCVRGKSTHTSYVIFEPDQVRLAAHVDRTSLTASDEDDDASTCRP